MNVVHHNDVTMNRNAEHVSLKPFSSCILNTGLILSRVDSVVPPYNRLPNVLRDGHGSKETGQSLLRSWNPKQSKCILKCVHHTWVCTGVICLWLTGRDGETGDRRCAIKVKPCLEAKFQACPDQRHEVFPFHSAPRPVPTTPTSPRPLTLRAFSSGSRGTQICAEQETGHEPGFFVPVGRYATVGRSSSVSLASVCRSAIELGNVKPFVEAESQCALLFARG